MLALGVVTAGFVFVLGGSFTSQIETGPDINVIVLVTKDANPRC